jgi:predicted transcriptional regulator
MERLSNCVHCGKLFIVSDYKACSQCLKETENLFKTCFNLLRTSGNHDMNIYELSERTNVSISQIYKLVLDGRLRNSS